VFLALLALKILYVTHSAGYRHDSLPESERVLAEAAARAGLEVTVTQDLSLISAETLREYAAVFFFTSGELALSERQKSDLLAFVRGGKGFGGAHSATDTLYGWPEYGELIGAYFDGHPWAQEVAIDVEDPAHPAMRHLGNSFRIADEIYQFRNFSRERVRVLLTLDPGSVDPGAGGVKRAGGDFALAWCRDYGAGRVFYTALGHGEETWRDPRFRTMIEQALLWLAGEIPADAAPRASAPLINPGGVVSNSGFAPGAQPGSVIAIFGAGLTSGSIVEATSAPALKLAGTAVEVNGAPIPLLYASPVQVNARLPGDLEPGATVRVVVRSATNASPPELLRILP